MPNALLQSWLNLPSRVRSWRKWPGWMRDDSPAEVERQYLRSLFGNDLSNSPASVLVILFVYSAAPTLPPGNTVFYWVIAITVYHCVRMLVGLSFMRRSDLTCSQLRYWGWVSLFLQLLSGLLLLTLALLIYPQLDWTAQSALLMVVLIIVGATASSLAGHWLSIAVYVVPTYFGFAWATWHQGHAYARPVAVLIGLMFIVYLFQAYHYRRSIEQALDLARRNGELAKNQAELATELQARNLALEEVAGERSRLLATVSHDLRQPSHAIGLLCERAMLDPRPEFVKEALADLHELSQSLSASLTTLMDLTRLDAGLVKTSLLSVPLSQVLLRVEAEFAGSARHRGLALCIPPAEVWVRSDPVLLHGILANLVSNAIKYTRVGRVDLVVEPRPDHVLLSVCDTGIGIHPDRLDQIFKEFVRLEGSEPGTEGLGLGLSIVRRYALLLGHRLSVTSEPGRGSCFAIELPRVAAQAEHVQPVSRSVALRDQRLVGLNVLVVDNVDLVLSSMTRAIAAWGCQVHAARSLSEALSVAERQPLDLLISDFHLGDQEPDGLMLIRSLRALQPAGAAPLPALLMTGDVSRQLEAQAQHDAVGIVHKPVRPSVLQDQVLHLLEPLRPD